MKPAKVAAFVVADSLWQKSGLRLMACSTPAQLSDYVSEYGLKLGGKPVTKSKKKEKLHVLLYGDSVDRVLLEDICEIGSGIRRECWVDPKSAPPPCQSLSSLTKKQRYVLPLLCDRVIWLDY